MEEEVRIVFMGTPDFAVESLKSIYEAGHEILAVVTNPDKPKGRGMKMIASPVKEYALEKNIKIYQPEKVKNNEIGVEDINEEYLEGVAFHYITEMSEVIPLIFE